MPIRAYAAAAAVTTAEDYGATLVEAAEARGARGAYGRMVSAIAPPARESRSRSHRVRTLGDRLTQRVANPLVTWLLRSPVHPLVSGRVVLLHYRGRRSGRAYSIPVDYAGDDRAIEIRAQSRRLWWRNLRGGAAVEVDLRGRRRRAWAEVAEPQEHGDLVGVRLTLDAGPPGGTD